MNSYEVQLKLMSQVIDKLTKELQELTDRVNILEKQDKLKTKTHSFIIKNGEVVKQGDDDE